MKRHCINFLILVNVIWCNADISDKFQFCSRSDPKINECLKSAIQNALSVLKNGFPDLNIPPLEPIKIPKWTVKALGPLNFDQIYTNIELQEHVSNKIKSVDLLIDNQQFSLTLVAFNPEIKYVADYDYPNAILGGIDMSSKGKCTATSSNYTNTVKFTGEIKKSGDAEYVFITDVKLSDVNADLVAFKYEAENVEVGKTLSTYFNDNWEKIVTKEKMKYADIYSEGYKNEANAIFARIPYNVLFPK